MSNVFVEKIYIKNSDVDMHDRWKYSSILDVIQEISSHHMSTIRSDNSELIKTNLAWVIARAKVEMTRIPSSEELITVKTWVSKPIKFIYPRYTLFEDAEGVEIGKAVELWSIIDVKTHQVILAPEGKINYFKTDENALIPLTLPSSLNMGDLDKQTYYKSVYCDIDLNQHVNNTKYFDWIFNIIDPIFLKTHFAKSVQINYVKEIKIGELVKLEWSLENDKLKIQGSVENKVCFSAMLDFIGG